MKRPVWLGILLAGLVLAVGLAAWFYFSRPGEITSLTADQLVKVAEWERVRGPLAWAPDGQRLAILDSTGIGLYDSVTTQKLQTFTAVQSAATLAFLPAPPGLGTGPYMLAAAGYNYVWVGDPATGQPLRETIELDGNGRDVLLSPDGRLFAESREDISNASVGYATQVWDIVSGALLTTIPEGARLAFSPDGSRLATGAFDHISLWEPRTGQLLRRFGNLDSVDRLAFSPSGDVLAYIPGSRQAIHLLDVKTGRPVALVRSADLADSFWTLEFSPDGQTLATLSPLTLWDARTGQKLRTLGEYASEVAFSPDGHKLAASLLSGAVMVWDTDRYALLSVIGMDRGYLAISPDGHTLVTQAPGLEPRVRLWDGVTGQWLRTLEGELTADFGSLNISFSPAGDKVAVSDAGVWVTATGQQLYALTDPIYALAFDPAGQMLATAIPGELHLRDAQTGQVLRTIPVPGGFHLVELAFSPNGQKVAAVYCAQWTGSGRTLRCAQNEIAWWNVQTGQREGVIANENIGRFAFVDDRTLVWTSSQAVEWWQTDGPRRVHALDSATLSKGYVWRCPSPTGRLFAEIDGEAGEVRLRDSRTGEILQTLDRSAGNPWDTYVVFSPGGRFMAINADNAVQLWDIGAP